MVALATRGDVLKRPRGCDPKFIAKSALGGVKLNSEQLTDCVLNSNEPRVPKLTKKDDEYYSVHNNKAVSNSPWVIPKRVEIKLLVK